MITACKPINLLFFMLLTIASVFYCPTTLAAEPEPIGKMVWVKGQVQATAPDGKSRILQRRSAIYEKDEITSSSHGTGQIVFTDGGLLSISAATSLRMERYQYNKTAPASDKYIVNVTKGGFRTITGAISKSNPEGYQVNTPVATIGVRGTDFSFYYVACAVGSNCGLSVKIIGGSISIQNAGGNIILTQGSNMLYANVITSTQAPTLTKQEPAVLKNNTPSIQPSAYQESTFSPGTTSTNPNISNKPVSGFCIQ